MKKRFIYEELNHKRCLSGVHSDRPLSKFTQFLCEQAPSHSYEAKTGGRPSASTAAELREQDVRRKPISAVVSERFHFFTALDSNAETYFLNTKHTVSCRCEVLWCVRVRARAQVC